LLEKKSNNRRKRRWGGIRLAPLSKPIKLRKPKEEPEEETANLDEPIVPQIEDHFNSSSEESKGLHEMNSEHSTLSLKIF